MGSVRITIRRLEKYITISLKERKVKPTFGCVRFDSIPQHAMPLINYNVGYIQNIDIESLSELAEKENFSVFVPNEVGTFLYRKNHLVYIESSKEITDEATQSIRNCFVIGEVRTFASDPRYGMSVLSGIGVKALSASLNDPGTAIDVISSLVRVLSILDDDSEEETKDLYKRVHFPKLIVQDLFNDAFYNLTMVGASHIQVLKSLQEAMHALSHSDREDIVRATKVHRKLIDERMREEFKLKTDLQNISSCYMIGENQRSVNTTIS